MSSSLKGNCPMSHEYARCVQGLNILIAFPLMSGEDYMLKRATLRSQHSQDCYINETYTVLKSIALIVHFFA